LPDASVVVETNWILDVALGQHEPSTSLLDLARRDEVQLFLPVICLTEAIKAFESKRGQWRDLANRLTATAADLGRNTQLDALVDSVRTASTLMVETADSLEQQLWETLEEARRIASPLGMDADTLSRAREIRNLLGLSPADAAVLSTVVGARDTCDEFISRDRRAFDTDESRSYLRGVGITYYADAAHFISARLRTR
jgi:predicted nucleic acid-binding protein